MSKFAKKPTEKIWTNDPTMQDQKTGITTEKGIAHKKVVQKKVDEKEAEKPAKATKAEKPAKATKAEKPAKATKAEKPSEDTRKITVVSKENPKSGKAAVRFNLYKTGMTVAAYIAAGGKKEDVAWDSKKGFIKVS